MTKKELWEEFKESGKIEDYLEYKKGKQYLNGNNKHRRNCHKLFKIW